MTDAAPYTWPDDPWPREPGGGARLSPLACWAVFLGAVTGHHVVVMLGRVRLCRHPFDVWPPVDVPLHDFRLPTVSVPRGAISYGRPADLDREASA